jgi:uncharacterized OsmC-like protein/alpha/beta superfamily hydrolase
VAETRTFTIAGSRGDQLVARLDMPDEDPRAVALMAHQFSGGNAGPAVSCIARSFSEQSVAVLSLHVAGNGLDGAKPDGGDLSTVIDDLAIVADQLRISVAAPSIVVGHSSAGAAALALASQIPEARAVVAIAIAAAASMQARPVQASARPHAREAFPRALLVLHSPEDEVVGIGQARSIFEAASGPRAFVSLDGADHRLSRPADAGYAASVMAAWAARYLPSSAGPDGGPAPARDARHEVVVTESDARPYGQRITAGGHHLTADEPTAFGGADSGPGPYDLLLAALGACTAMTVRMYAERKGWGLRHTTVRLRHERVHAADCAGCETPTSLLDHIQRELTFDGDLSDEQRARLLAIAERCPVHRTLRAGALVSTTEST